MSAARRYAASLTPFASGFYVNAMTDEGAAGVARAYWPAKLARLRALKAAYEFGRKYVEFDIPSSAIELALYGGQERRPLVQCDRRAPARPRQRRRPFTDPYGFVCEAASR
jgi:hypothetical protein